MIRTQESTQKDTWNEKYLETTFYSENKKKYAELLFYYDINYVHVKHFILIDTI
jgi:hypothetical protein